MSSRCTRSCMALPLLFLLLVALLAAHVTTALPWTLHRIHDTRASPEAHIFAYPGSGFAGSVPMGLVFHIPTVDLYSVLGNGKLPENYYLVLDSLSLTQDERGELMDRFGLTCSIFGAGGTETQSSVASRGVDPEGAATAAGLVLHRFNYFTAGFYLKPEAGAAKLPTHITIDCRYGDLPVEWFEKMKTMWQRITFTWFIEGHAVDDDGKQRAFVDRLYGARFEYPGFSDAHTTPTAHTHGLVPLFTNAAYWPSWSSRLFPLYSAGDANNPPAQKQWLSSYHKTFILDSNKLYEKMQVPSFLERDGNAIMNTFMVRIAAPELPPADAGLWSAAWSLYRAPSDRVGYRICARW